MRWLYNILFLAGFVISSPYYFWRLWRRGNWLKGFGQRFGQYDKNLRQAITNRHVVWVHAVSVGEVNLCVEFVRALQVRIPNAKIMVSTTTTTGMAELHKKLPGMFGKIYYPIDRRKYVDYAFRVLHPSAVILVETEIWPNFIWRAQSAGTPLFLINGRLSAKSHSRYLRLSPLFRRLFGAFTGIGAQTEEYATQFRQLGGQAAAVQVTGNLKFDAAKIGPGKDLEVPGLLNQVGVSPDALLLVAGSTHAGEEEVLADQFLRLRARHPKLFLILVPRHFERAKDLGRGLTKKLRVFYRSDITGETRLAPGSVDCLLVNTTGELMSFYRHATIAFVGKSLAATGGQNPIEPAALGKTTVFGPNMQNFRDVARLLVSEGAAIQVRNAQELEKTFDELLANAGRRRQLGETAEATVRRNQGAIGRTIEMVLPHLARQGLYIAPEQPEQGPAPISSAIPPGTAARRVQPLRAGSASETATAAPAPAS